MTAASSPGTLTIGYLQVGPPEHGISRYGRSLARAARSQAGISVVEHNLVLSGSALHDRSILRHAARGLSAVDLVHLQVSVWATGTWGRTWHALANLRHFRRHCRAPIVATLHDVNSLASLECVRPASLLGRAVREAIKAGLRPGTRLLKQLCLGTVDPRQLFRELWRFEPTYPWLITQEVVRMARRVLVLTESEEALLRVRARGACVARIPHFVEGPAGDHKVRSSSRTGEQNTIVVAGFIFGSKGHELVLEAMPLLPDVKVIFLGGASIGSSPALRDRLLELARRKGVENRLEVTGYLPDTEYVDRIHGADLGLCPFTVDKSGSGTLSALIAAGCPILASDIPLIAEYNAVARGAIPTFSPYTPDALAGAIRSILATPRSELIKPLEVLRRRLSISIIYEQHLAQYRRTLQSASTDSMRLSRT